METQAEACVLPLTNGDMGSVEQWLTSAYEQVLQEKENVGEADKSQLKSICDATLQALRELSHLQASTSGEGGEQQPGEAAQQHEMAAEAGVMDSAVVELHQQVLAQVAKVNNLRQEVPQVISAAVQRELEALRPTAGMLQELTETGMAAHAGAQPSEAAAVPEVEEAKHMLSDAMDKLPGLRARLDQAVSRLNRVISAFEMEQARPSPRTVEKVLARASCGAAGQDDTAAEGDKEVAATRRRLANDLMAAANAIR